MKYKLLDVENLVEEGVEFGTCDLCSYLGNNYYDVLIFEDADGNRYEVENGGWSWGWYMTNWDIENYVAFADFVRSRNYPEPKINRYGQPLIEEIVYQMYNDFCEWEEKK